MSQRSLFRQRLRSPLRWLSAIMSGLMMVGLAGIAQQPWLIVLSPVLVGLFLLAPPLGIYRHDETPVETTRVHLQAIPVSGDGGQATTFRFVVVNDGDVSAENFRIRLLVPVDIVPASATGKLLGALHTGVMGRHWFTETTYVATAVTFRAGRPGEPDALVCPPHETLELIDLNFPTQHAPYRLHLAYQVNGGTVSASLSQVAVNSS